MNSSSLNKKRASVIKANAAAATVNLTTQPVMNKFEAKATHALREPEVAAAEEHKTGYDAGYAQGLAQAQADIAQATDDANRRVRHALAALTEAVDNLDQRQTVALGDVEDAIVAGAFALARTVLQRELISATDPGGDALARALQLVPDRGEVVARLHPDDAATLNLQRIEASGRQIIVVADPGIEIGGCVVQIGEMNIDAQLSSALFQAAKAMNVDRDLAQTNEPLVNAELAEVRSEAAAAVIAGVAMEFQESSAPAEPEVVNAPVVATPRKATSKAKSAKTVKAQAAPKRKKA